MLTAIVTGVIVSLIVAGILAGARWLSHEQNRERLRELACSHEWRSLDERNAGSSGLRFVSPYADECVKCGARR
jgi:hypothetical protein